MSNAGKPDYDVAFSFAEENRDFVEGVAKRLKQNKIQIFYDRDEELNLWGKDLSEILDDIYRVRSRYIVIFISEHYSRKMWTNYERKSALARVVKEGDGAILPVRFDDTELPGFRPTLKYIDLRHETADSLASKIIQKVKNNQSPPKLNSAVVSSPVNTLIRIVIGAMIMGILLISWNTSSCQQQTHLPQKGLFNPNPQDTFSITLLVQDKDFQKAVPMAKVIVWSSEVPLLTVVADKDGQARLPIENRYLGKRVNLQVEAGRYNQYKNIIDLIPSNTPDIVPLSYSDSAPDVTKYEIKVNKLEQTNISVSPQDYITVTATGSVNVGPIVGNVGPNGKESNIGVSLAEYNIVQGIPHGALIYRVAGEKEWQFCGSSKGFRPDSTGHLEFNVNDIRQENNGPSAYFHLKIMARRSL